MPTRDYEDYLAEKLKDPEEAAGYLTACLEEGPDVFLLGVRDVAKAQGGMKKLSEDTELAREALYRMFSDAGNPTFASISSVIESLGIKIKFAPKLEGSKSA
jgi:probable addiction module antidote protein